MTRDAVNPKHYKDVYPFEVIDLIADILTPSEVIGYCLGNEIKYRMRAGIKDPDKTLEDISKAEWYRAKRIEYERAISPDS